MAALQLPALARSTSSKSGVEGLSSTQPSAPENKRRPLLPVIHTAKARNVAGKDSEYQVRCFYALSHRGGNHLESEFHMQARMGFRPTRQRSLRLRPLEDLPAPTPSPRPYRRSSKQRRRPHGQGSRHGSRQGSREQRQHSAGKKPPSRASASPKHPPAGLSQLPEVVHTPEAARITGSAFNMVSDEIVGSAIQNAFDFDGTTSNYPEIDPASEYDSIVREASAAFTAELIEHVRSPSSPSKGSKPPGMLDAMFADSDTEPLVSKHISPASGLTGRGPSSDHSTLRTAMPEAPPTKPPSSAAVSSPEAAVKISSQVGHSSSGSAGHSDLAPMSTFSQAEADKATKIQAGVRGRLARKQTRQLKESGQVQSETAATPPSVPSVPQVTPASHALADLRAAPATFWAGLYASFPPAQTNSAAAAAIKTEEEIFAATSSVKRMLTRIYTKHDLG